MPSGGSSSRVELSWRLMTAGSCGQVEKFTNTTKPLKSIQFPAHFSLIHHHKEGYILVDTGYSDHFHDAAKNFPYSLYAKITPIQFKPGDSAVEQLAALGIHSSDVKYIFITHFHADHISGLLDFPNAKFICSRKAYGDVQDKKGIAALLKGFLPDLLPEDFAERVLFLEDGKIASQEDLFPEAASLEILNSPIYDVFGDGSIFSVDLSGHAHGQMGLLFKQNDKVIFLVADAAWDSSAVRNLEMPSKITKLIIHDYEVFRTTLTQLHHFYKKHPHVAMIPSHCREYKGESR